MTRLAWTWIAIALAAGVAGLFARAESGPEAIPFFMPLLGTGAVVVVVVVVRLLKPLLERGRDYYGSHDAD